jgi:23S rRNA pseudouridine2605 synthase
MRLNKFLSLSGTCSRRTADRWITSGLISVNGRITKKLGVCINPSRDRVTAGGKKVTLPAVHRYLVMNKPEGVLVSKRGAAGRKTVFDLLKAEWRNVNSCGRLDLYTSGLLILTSDGELLHRITHPRYGIPRVYSATVHKPWAEALRSLAEGVELEDGFAKPDSLSVRPGKEHDKATLLITLREGRNREIRRMFRHVGVKFNHLKRIKFAGLTLGNLRPGQARELTPEQIRRVKKSVNLK